MDDPSITPPPLAGRTRERRDEDQIETVRRAVVIEDLERAALSERSERSTKRAGDDRLSWFRGPPRRFPTTSPDDSVAIRSGLPGTGWGQRAAWIALGVLSACGFAGLMIGAGRGTSGATNARPSGEPEPEAAQRDRQPAPTTTERNGLRHAEARPERGVPEDEIAPAARARRRPRSRPALDRACQVRVAETEARHEEPRRPPPRARSYRLSDDPSGSWSRKPSSKPFSTAGPPLDAANEVTVPTPLRSPPEGPDTAAGFRSRDPNDSPVLL